MLSDIRETDSLGRSSRANKNLAEITNMQE